MTERGDEMGELQLLFSVEPQRNVLITDDEFAAAITRRVDHDSQELATFGISGPEIEVEAVEMVTEVVGLAVEYPH